MLFLLSLELFLSCSYFLADFSLNVPIKQKSVHISLHTVTNHFYKQTTFLPLKCLHL